MIKEVWSMILIWNGHWPVIDDDVVSVHGDHHHGQRGEHHEGGLGGAGQAAQHLLANQRWVLSIVAPAPPITAHLAAAQHPEVVDDVDEVEGHGDHAEQHVGHRQVQDEDVLRGAQQLQPGYTRHGSSNFYHFMRHAQYSDTTDIVYYSHQPYLVP